MPEPKSELKRWLFDYIQYLSNSSFFSVEIKKVGGSFVQMQSGARVMQTVLSDSAAQ